MSITSISSDLQNLTSLDDKEKDENAVCSQSDVHCWKCRPSIVRLCSTFNGIGVKWVSLGDNHALVLSNEFQVYSVGVNDYGQLGLGDRSDRKIPREIGFLSEKNISHVVCGSRHSCALSMKGQLFCWGDSRHGQCGLGEKGIFTTPCKVNFALRSQCSDSLPKTVRVERVACGDAHTLALDAQGALWCWGAGVATGFKKDVEEVLLPERVSKMQNKHVIDIACGRFYSMALVKEELNPRLSRIENSSTHSMRMSSSDYDDNCMQRTDSNVTQKIPFLENVFYVEDEEDSSINWSMDLQKFPRRDTSPSFCEEDSHNDDKDGDLNDDQSEGIEGNSLSKQSMNESSVSDLKPMKEDVCSERKKSNSHDNIRSPLTFENKMFGTESDAQCASMQRSRSLPTIKKLETSDMPVEKVNNVDDGEKKMDETLEIPEKGDSMSKIVSTNDIYFSAFDIPVDTDNTTLSSNKSSTESSSEYQTDQTSESTNPLNLSLNEGMETVIMSDSCAVVYDESAITKSSRPKSELLFSAKASLSHDIDKIGSSLEITNSSQIWVWGENEHGQLGLDSSIKKSYEPKLLDSLKGQGIIKISAGEKHVLALTRSCQVFGWGDNTSGQLGLNESNIPKPRIIDILHGFRVWDVAACGNSSVFLADSANDACEMYLLGNSTKGSEAEFVSIIHTSSAGRRKSIKKKRISLTKSKRQTSTDSNNSEWYIDADLQKINHFSKNLMLRAVVASDGQFASITPSDGNQLSKIMHKLASSERNFYHQIGLIQDYIMTPLINTESWSSVIKQPGGEAMLPLLECFNDVIHSIRIGLWQLTETVKKGLAITDLFSFFLSDSFRAVYDRYSKCYCDALAVGHLHSLSKTVSHIISKCEESIRNVFSSLLLEQDDFSALLKLPLRRSSYYSKCVEKISRCKKAMTDSNEGEISQLLQVVQRWQIFADETSKRLGEANQTKKFWDESSSKLIEALKDPHRRILKTSKDTSINLARASRLTNHQFMLFNDVFVHSQSSKHFQVFPLVTLWAEPLLDPDQQKFALKITAPEASFVLTTNSEHERIEWLKELNETIARCLSATSSHKISAESVNSISGKLSAADAREAPYVYVNHQKYKGARYFGMWLLGVPHGRGQMKWTNGSTYEGEFVNGIFNGYGIMMFASTNDGNNEQRYEGDWMDGKMHGYGKMNYADGHEYVGHWENDMRIGHGTLKSISADRGLQTIYVGDWLNDQKQGYGVQDFIVRGEKYIGMWLNNQRHGYGIVVTVDGVYCEGRFVQNKLVGKGILLSDDDTCYEGEFTADMQLSGKGVLTMPNGDYIEGQFHGNWGEGIKINGTFNKFANPDPGLAPVGEIASSQLSLTDFSIPAGVKWKSLFEACRVELGAEHENCENVWKNIEKSVIKTRSSDLRTKSVKRRNFNKEINFIKEPKIKNKDCYAEIKRYLTESIDTFGHPLNTLVEALVEVYRATYVGVGAHRRLLLHAVEEAKSYVSRLFSIVRLLFPSLPDEDFIILSNNKANGEDERIITSAMLLHPIILPRLYPPLFTLYALHTEKIDALYTERLHQLNKREDVALMSFLGVGRKFLLVDFDEETKLPIKRGRSPYASAVDELETISTKYSPMEKIEVIRRSFAKVHEEVYEFWKGKKKLMAMDDLFPVFQYIVTRARIPHLGSEIQFIEDLVERSVLVGELGHMVTTLKACFFQIQNEQDRE